MITRREALRLGGLALAGASLAPACLGRAAASVSDAGWVFFPDTDISRIKENARTILLGPTFREWAANSPHLLNERWATFEETHNIVYDLGRMWGAFTETAVVQLVEPSVARRDALLKVIESVALLPKWDYLMNGDEDLGLMRASMATSRLLFAREVLRNEISADLDSQLLKSIAEKGVAPCSRTVRDMDEPIGVTGWHNDSLHPKINDNDMSRWPEILGANNLRGAATMGLGMGALALLGRDERAEQWLSAAERSTQKTFSFFSDDGSYFEGMSYAAYALRLLLPFCEAHTRIKGTIDWSQALNWSGVSDNIAAMQAGYKTDGTPDVVNFSDAASSIYPCVGSWIRERTGIELGQYAATHFSVPGYFLDYLWYKPNESAKAPSEKLKNYRGDLDWIVCRSGWRAQDAVLAFRSGLPANHEHADRNSFIYKIYGERLLTDHFGAAYDPGDSRWKLRLTEAHNAVLIGGRGHQYHEGEEGVNEGKAKAEVVQYFDESQRIWWSSDSTHGYKLINENVSKVLRTVCFAKPNVLIVLDQVSLVKPDKVELRYFPDNRDGEAKLEVSDERFSIERPNAVIYGVVSANTSIAVDSAKLDLGSNFDSGETFPFVNGQTESAKEHSILTVMVARHRNSGNQPEVSIAANALGWEFKANGVQGILDTNGKLPKLEWINEI